MLEKNDIMMTSHGHVIIDRKTIESPKIIFGKSLVRNKSLSRDIKALLPKRNLRSKRVSGFSGFSGLLLHSRLLWPIYNRVTRVAQ